MTVANTLVVSLVPSGWTLLADGDAGVTDVLVQLSTTGSALLSLALSPPTAGVTNGIVLTSEGAAFSAALMVGQKLYGRASGSNVSVNVMMGGE